jgi:hypothetical protein
LTTFQEQTDKLAMAIGYALAAWSEVEDALADFYQSMHGQQWQEAQLQFAGERELKKRLNLVVTKFKYESETDRNKKIWFNLENIVVNNYKSRHQLAHFSFIGSRKGESVRALMVPFWPSANYDTSDALTLEQIANLSAEFKKISDAVRWFSNRAKHRSYGQESLYPAPELVQSIIDKLSQRNTF